MNGAELRRAQLVFEEALRFDELEERSAFLAEVCFEPSLRKKVEELLASDAREDIFLAEPLTRPSDRTALEGLENDFPLRLRKIGSYEILGEIGRGGMSTVFLAQTTDSVPSTEVALKVIREDVLVPEANERFGTEQRILASLRHPYIARFLDGGTTQAGQPFLVMEYVEGLPISEFCDTRALTVKARIELFRKVCEGVQYAHQQLIVHRDLKPRNILVDAQGNPRLLDFGIAKLMVPGLTADPTVVSTPVLTPSYAAPEHFAGDRVTTATDVYSLGVLLYQLLCGRRPYSWQGKPAHRVLELWERFDPLPPSDASIGEDVHDTGSDFVEGGDSGWLASARGFSSSAALARRLEGDLDNIVLKSLRFEATQRYQSVQALSDDLGRHLDGRPVTARPATLGYRLGRFARRHAIGLVNGITIFALLLGLTGVSLVQSKRVAEERDIALRQEERAQIVTRFLVDSFAQIDPASGLAGGVSAKDLLDRGAQRISADLSSEPEVKATLHQSVGTGYLGLGLFDDAIEQFRFALSLRRELFADDQPEVSETLTKMAEALAWRGDLQAARDAAQEALEMRRRGLGDSDPMVGSSLRQMAGLAAQLGDLEDANRLATRALDIHRHHLSPQHIEIARSLTSLMEVQFELGHLERAEQLGKEALEMSRRVFPSSSLEITKNISNLGTTVRAQGRLEEAETLYREALDQVRTQLGDEHPRVASALNDLGGLKTSQAEYDIAEALHRQAVELLRKRLGPKHPHVGRALSNVGVALMAARRFDQAEPLFEKALSVYREHFGELHPLVGEASQHLGGTLYLQGRLRAAEKAVAAALAARRSALGDQHERTGESRMVMGRIQRELGHVEAAEDHFRQGLAAFRASRGEAHWLTAIGHMRLAEALSDLGRTAEAEQEIRVAVGIFDRGEEPAHLLRAAEARGILGTVLSALGRKSAAEEALLQSYEELHRQKGEDAKQTREALLRVVSFYQQWEDQEAAEGYRAKL